MSVACLAFLLGLRCLLALRPCLSAWFALVFVRPAFLPFALWRVQCVSVRPVALALRPFLSAWFACGVPALLSCLACAVLTPITEKKRDFVM